MCWTLVPYSMVLTTWSPAGWPYLGCCRSFRKWNMADHWRLHWQRWCSLEVSLWRLQPDPVSGIVLLSLSCLIWGGRGCLFCCVVFCFSITRHKESPLHTLETRNSSITDCIPWTMSQNKALSCLSPLSCFCLAFDHSDRRSGWHWLSFKVPVWSAPC